MAKKLLYFSEYEKFKRFVEDEKNNVIAIAVSMIEEENYYALHKIGEKKVKKMV